MVFLNGRYIGRAEFWPSDSVFVEASDWFFFAREIDANATLDGASLFIVCPD